MLPPTFGLLIDGWTIDSEHYNGVYVLWTSNGVAKKYLLSCNVIEDVDEETDFVDQYEGERAVGFSAADWCDVLCICLNDEDIGVDIDPNSFAHIVEFIAADNCSTNQRLCTDLAVPMVGCNSHRLHLEIEGFIGPKEKKNARSVVIREESRLRGLIRKLDRLMGELKSLKNAALLRTQTLLLPERKNDTRWYSLFKMLLKWSKISHAVSSVESFPRSVLELIPTAAENLELHSLLEDLKVFESVSQALQRDGQGSKSMVSMEGVRALFDGLVDKFAQKDQVSLSLTLSLILSMILSLILSMILSLILSIILSLILSMTLSLILSITLSLILSMTLSLIQVIGSHIKPGSDVVHSPDFENGIVKIQGFAENTLTDAEKRAVKIFLIEGEQIEEEDTQDLGFADQLLASTSSRKKAKTSAYRDTRHVHPTTNLLERLFSRCKLNMTALRKKMDPDSLDMLMFLKANKELWPDAKSVQHLLDSLTPGDWANTLVEDEEEEAFEEW